MKLRTTVLMLGLLGAAGACGESQIEQAEPTADAGETRDATEPSTQDADRDLDEDGVFSCSAGGQLELSWQPDEGAVEYLVEAVRSFDGGTLEYRVEQPHLRVTQRFEKVKVSAIDAGGNHRELFHRFVSGGPAFGDMVLLRARKGASTVIERLGCMSRKRPGTGTIPLGEDVSPMPIAERGPSSMRNSARFFFGDEHLPGEQRLLFVDGEQLLGMRSPEDYVIGSRFPDYAVIDHGVVSASPAAMTLGSDAFYAADAEGRVMRGNPLGGAPEAVVDARVLQGRSVQALHADEEGLWVLAIATESSPSSALLHFATIHLDANPDRDIALPDDGQGPWVFDGVGLLLGRSDAEGQIHQLVISPQQTGWRPWRSRVPHLLSLSTTGSGFRTEPRTLAVGGVEGNELFELETAGEPRAHYRFEGVTDMDIMGFQGFYQLSVP